MSIYIPKIKNYAPFYMQKVTDSAATDIQQTYGVTIKQHDYPMQLAVKEPYKNEWKDEDGDDEYLGKIFFEAKEISYDCVILVEKSTSDAARTELRTLVDNFQRFVASGELLTFDSYTKFGFTGVRLIEFSQISEGNFKELDGKGRVIFTMRLKVDNPLSETELSNGKIVPKVTTAWR